jgi:hypothetical protein
MDTMPLKWEGVALCIWTLGGTATTVTVAAEATCTKTTTTTCITMAVTGETCAMCYVLLRSAESVMFSEAIVLQKHLLEYSAGVFTVHIGHL